MNGGNCKSWVTFYSSSSENIHKQANIEKLVAS